MLAFCPTLFVLPRAALPLVVEMPAVPVLPLLLTTTATFEETVFGLILALTFVSTRPFLFTVVAAVLVVAVLEALELVAVSPPHADKRLAAARVAAKAADLFIDVSPD